MVCSAVVSRDAFHVSFFIRPRLLGYAGAPIILFTPCFILSIVTTVRILRMHARIPGFRLGESNQTQSTRVATSGLPTLKSRRPPPTPLTAVSVHLPPP